MDDMPMNEVIISDVYALACEDAENTLIVQMTLSNEMGMRPSDLTAAMSPVAEAATIVAGEDLCNAESVEDVMIAQGQIVTFNDENLAVRLTMAEDYEAGTPFNLDLAFGMMDAEMNEDEEAARVRVGVPVVDTTPDPAPFVINAASVWARPTVAGDMMGDMDDEGDMDMDDEDDMDMMMGATSAVYMNITNATDTDTSLVSGTTEITEIVEIHETSLDENDVMRMRPIEAGILVPAGGEATLRPGGFHVMLLDPQPMAPGDTITLTLTFEDGETVTVAAPVEDRVESVMNMDMDG